MNCIFRKGQLLMIVLASLLVTQTFGAAIELPKGPHNVKPFHSSKPDLQRRAVEPFFEIDVKSLDENSPISDLCKKDLHVIESAQKLFHLQNQCEFILGSLQVTNYDSNILDLNSLRAIGGDLIIQDSPELIRIQAANLNKIEGLFQLQGLTSLVSVEIPTLKFCQSLEWKVVPILNYVSMDSQNIEILRDIIISDTSLANIENFNKVQEIDTFNINNNRFLETIHSNVKTIRGQFSVHANAKELELEMPYLREVENITIRDTSLVYLPQLTKVKSSLEFIENYFYELNLNNLEKVGGTLGIINNVNLIKIDLENVTDIQGGLMITDNDSLEDITFLPNLKQIGGAIFFEGSFKDIMFDSLKLVKGSAFIKSSSNVLDCNKWTNPSNGRSIIRGGKFTCISGKKENTLNVKQDGTIIEKGYKDLTQESEDSKRRVISKFTNSTTSTTQLNIFLLGICLLAMLLL
ncbi:YCL048W [Saccharomyces arboricola H-6]|uniref:YCL048W n=1 Tax=Saccharomyces arboricola (strain H-6 / AS 2.3317 / CBS 10644) TaxID=1160507 RepID=J8PR37_SACAR|nr:YCL048W [Saccharomyces arboricola H-6]